MVDARIEVVELVEQPAMVVRRQITFDEISTAMGDIFPRVFQYVIGAGQQPAGMPFMRYFDMDDGVMRVAAGVPVASSLAGADDIEAHVLPGGRALTTTHLGDYSALGKVWQQVWARARELGSTQRFGGWEVYANAPGEVAPEAQETRIHLPLDAAP